VGLRARARGRAPAPRPRELGRLASITDGDGNATAIARNAAGDPTAIVAPFGQTTALTTSADGYLATVRNPAGETTTLTYTADGALESLTDPKGNRHELGYSPWGALTSDKDPAGGQSILDRVETSATAYTVSLTTAEGRTTQYGGRRTSPERLALTTTSPSGQTNMADVGSTTTATFADGTMTSQSMSSDPRWRTQAAFAGTSVVTTPAGLHRETTTTRSVTLADPLDLTSLVDQTDIVTINGRSYATEFTASTRRLVTTSPEGRSSTTEIDAQGRVVKREVPGRAPVSYSYDTHGRLVSVVRGTPPDARTLRHRRLAFGNNRSARPHNQLLERVRSIEVDRRAPRFSPRPFVTASALGVAIH
jgi:YD repeat-containing protein